MNTSPTERTPAAGRQEYLSAGNASASWRNLLWRESSSVRYAARTDAASNVPAVCAAAGRVAPKRVSAANAPAWTARRTDGFKAARMKAPLGRVKVAPAKLA